MPLALEQNGHDDFGIWGGTSERQRRIMRTERNTATPRGVAVCGTRSGYMRHVRNHEKTCDECKAANAAYQAELKARTRPPPACLYQGERPSMSTKTEASEQPGGWVDGIGWVALLCDLAEGDNYNWSEHAAVRDAGTVPLQTPVIVTRWADGEDPFTTELRRRIIAAISKGTDYHHVGAGRTRSDYWCRKCEGWYGVPHADFDHSQPERHVASCCCGGCLTPERRHREGVQMLHPKYLAAWDAFQPDQRWTLPEFFAGPAVDAAPPPATQEAASDER